MAKKLVEIDFWGGRSLIKLVRIFVLIENEPNHNHFYFSPGEPQE
jgi:hypothetical protein